MKYLSSGIIATLIAIFCIWGVAFPKEPSYPPAPKYVNPAGDELPIVCSYIFFEDAPVKRKAFKEMEEAGFNIFRASMTEPKLLATLDSMDDTRMKMMFYIWEALDSTRTVQMVNKYKDNPKISCYFVKDEPFGDQIEATARLNSLFVKADSTKITYINLLPKLRPESLKAPDYDTYVSSFVQTVNPALLSFDCYPILKKRGPAYIEPNYFPSIETISRVSRESGRPFWTYILSVAREIYPKMNRNYLRFQMFAALAYGSQGFNFFTYCLPDFDRKTGEFSNAPIDNKGNKTDVWYMVRDINQEVKALEHIFYGAEVIDVRHTGVSLPDSTRRLRSAPKPFNWIGADPVGIIVSHFKNGEDEYVMFVNKDLSKKQTVRFSLSRPVMKITADGKERRENGNSVTLQPGSYAIYRLNAVE